MVASIVVNWLIGLAMAGSGRKKTWLVLSVVWNLSLMFVFKYLTFVLSNVELLLHRNIADIEISLPLGISFLRSRFSVIFLISIMGTQRCRRIVISLRSMCLCSHNWWQDLSCVMNRLRMRLTTGRRIWRIFPRYDKVRIRTWKKVLLSNYMGTIADNMFYLSGNSNLSAASAWLGESLIHFRFITISPGIRIWRLVLAECLVFIFWRTSIIRMCQKVSQNSGADGICPCQAGFVTMYIFR